MNGVLIYDPSTQLETTFTNEHSEVTLSGYAVVRRICDLYSTFTSFDVETEEEEDEEEDGGGGGGVVKNELFQRDMKSGRKGDVYNLVSGTFYIFLTFS